MFRLNKKINGLPNVRQYKSIKRIKGLSLEEKYCITMKNGNKLLLVINDICKSIEKQKELEWRTALYQKGIPTNEAIEFGICDKGKSIYQIYLWIEGESLCNILPRMSAEEQYKIGRKAGKLLKKIHEIQVPFDDVVPVSLEYKIEQCKHKYNVSANGDSRTFLEFIEKNKGVTLNRVNRILHGDYHLGNLIYNTGGELAVIDWVPGAVGDPWEDFVRIIVSAETSPFFACGQIDAYFDDSPPTYFWKILALYTAIHELEIVDWNLKSPDSKMTFAEYQNQIVLEQYDGMKEIIPLYYRNIKHI